MKNFSASWVHFCLVERPRTIKWKWTFLLLLLFLSFLEQFTIHFPSYSPHPPDDDKLECHCRVLLLLLLSSTFEWRRIFSFYNAIATRSWKMCGGAEWQQKRPTEMNSSWSGGMREEWIKTVSRAFVVCIISPGAFVSFTDGFKVHHLMPAMMTIPFESGVEFSWQIL